MIRRKQLELMASTFLTAAQFFGVPIRDLRFRGSHSLKSPRRVAWLAAYWQHSHVLTHECLAEYCGMEKSAVTKHMRIATDRDRQHAKDIIARQQVQESRVA